MRWVVEYSSEASNEIDSLSPMLAERIVRKIASFCATESPLTFAKPLSGKLHGLYRFRIGDYRAIFEILPSGEIRILNILSVKHRKDVYR